MTCRAGRRVAIGAVSLVVTIVALVATRPASAAIEADAQIPSVVYTHPAKMFAVERRRRLNLFCLGEGEPTVVFISGAWQNTMTWRRVQGRVAQFSRACSYDRAGLGFSDPAARDSNAANTVNDLNRLLKAAKIKTPVVLVGHSVGGLYAMHYAATYQNQVAGLVLIDPSDPEADNNFVLAGRPAKYADEARQQTESNHQMLRNCVILARQRKLTAGNTDPYCLMNETDPVLKKELDRQHVRLQTKEAILSEMISQESPIEGNYSLNALQFRNAFGSGNFGQLPLILLTRADHSKHPALPQGEFDRNLAVFLAGQERMARYSSIGSVRKIPNSGHNIQLDQPEMVITAIRDVVAEHRHREAQAK